MLAPPTLRARTKRPATKCAGGQISTTLTSRGEWRIICMTCSRRLTRSRVVASKRRCSEPPANIAMSPDVFLTVRFGPAANYHDVLRAKSNCPLHKNGIGHASSDIPTAHRSLASVPNAGSARTWCASCQGAWAYRAMVSRFAESTALPPRTSDCPCGGAQDLRGVQTRKVRSTPIAHRSAFVGSSCH